MGSMQFKGTNVHLHVDGAELCLGLPKSPELPKLTIEKPRTLTTARQSRNQSKGVPESV
jgi:hypothetical protein